MKKNKKIEKKKFILKKIKKIYLKIKNSKE